MYMPDSVRSVGERVGASPSPVNSDGWESMDSSQIQLPSRLARRRRSRSRESFQRGIRPLIGTSNTLIQTNISDRTMTRSGGNRDSRHYEDFTNSRNSLNLSRYSPPECLHFNDSDSLTASADELKAESKNAMPPSLSMNPSSTSSVDDIKELGQGHSPSTSNTRSTVFVERKTDKEIV